MDAVEALPAVANWLSHACEHKGQDLEAYTFDNIRHQVENLLTYPLIKQKVEDESLQIEAWYFDIGTGNVVHL